MKQNIIVDDSVCLIVFVLVYSRVRVLCLYVLCDICNVITFADILLLVVLFLLLAQFVLLLYLWCCMHTIITLIII